MQIGSQLHVRAVVVGRLSQHGDTVNVETEMVDVSNGSQIWGEQYRRKASDIATVQDDIASDISGQLRLKLSGEEKKHLAEHGTENSEAYQLYVKGRFYLEQRTREGSYKAVDQFNQAIAKDSAYAQAYTGLGDAYVILLDQNAIPADQASSKVRSAAQRAMELDPSLAEPHAELAVLREMVDWDWTGAEAEYRKAIGLNPNDATAHQWYALLLENLGRINEGFDQIRKAQALDPASPQINQNAAGFLMDMHRYPEAMNWLHCSSFRIAGDGRRPGRGHLCQPEVQNLRVPAFLVANQPTDTNLFTLHPDVRAAAAFGTAVVLGEGAASELSRDLSANILLILRPRSAGVKGFWMSDTPAISISARRNSPL